jgi:hypothetical protein
LGEVALADVAALVEGSSVGLTQLIEDLAGFGDEFGFVFEEGEDGNFVGREFGVEF